MTKTELIKELEEIVKDDQGLDPVGFFDRVCRSIKNNGAERTASTDIYNLPLEFVLKVEQWLKKAVL